jgi:hypothetical protein
MRHVGVGEELLIDYGWSHADRESRGYQIYLLQLGPTMENIHKKN